MPGSLAPLMDRQPALGGLIDGQLYVYEPFQGKMHKGYTHIHILFPHLPAIVYTPKTIGTQSRAHKIISTALSVILIA